MSLGLRQLIKCLKKIGDVLEFQIFDAKLRQKKSGTSLNFRYLKQNFVNKNRGRPWILDFWNKTSSKKIRGRPWISRNGKRPLDQKKFGDVLEFQGTESDHWTKKKSGTSLNLLNVCWLNAIFLLKDEGGLSAPLTGRGHPLLVNGADEERANPKLRWDDCSFQGLTALCHLLSPVGVIPYWWTEQTIWLLLSQLRYMTNALLAGSSKMFQAQYFSQSTSTCEHSGVDFCQFKSLDCVQNFKLIYRTKFAVVSGWFENEDGEQHGRGPSLQTDILHLTYSESSLAARRRKLRGQCSLKQMERRRIVSKKKLGLPTRQSLRRKQRRRAHSGNPSAQFRRSVAASVENHMWLAVQAAPDPGWRKDTRLRRRQDWQPQWKRTGVFPWGP